jgi:hypothetical protein
MLEALFVSAVCVGATVSLTLLVAAFLKGEGQ